MVLAQRRRGVRSFRETMITWRSLAACAVVVLCVAAPVDAQTTRGYAGAAITVAPWSVQSVSGGTPSTSFSNESPDTIITDVTAEGGWRFTPKSALGVEVVLPLQRVEIHQEFRYFSPQLRYSAYQETLVLIVVRRDVRLGTRASMAFVAGGGFVHGTSRERRALGHFGSPDYGPFGPEEDVSKTSLGVTAGVDFSVTLARHVDLVPRFRLLFVGRGDPRDDHEPFFGSLGLSALTYRVGIGVRATF
jgi:opacity protein-like surface antigen